MAFYLLIKYPPTSFSSFYIYSQNSPVVKIILSSWNDKLYYGSLKDLLDKGFKALFLIIKTSWRMKEMMKNYDKQTTS